MKWRLKELMDKNNDSMDDLAVYLDITYQTLSKKLNGHSDFTQTEIKKIKQRYNLTADEVCRVFLADD